MDQLKQKLTSQSGASITYALLLFLVCAVVSSIVLAAGTAASGRISGSVGNDQRYYSVTSAADMLIKYFDGVTIETQTTQTGTSTTDLGSPAIVNNYPVLSRDGEPINDTSNYTLLILAMSLYTETASDTASFPAGKEMVITVGEDQNATLEFSFGQEKDQSDSGRFIFKISSYDEDSDDPYTLYMVFDADIKEVEDSSTKDVYSESASEMTSVVTVTTTTEATWTLTSMSLTEPSGWESAEETEAG